MLFLHSFSLERLYLLLFLYLFLLIDLFFLASDLLFVFLSGLKSALLTVMFLVNLPLLMSI